MADAQPRVVVIGLDGATFKQILPMVESGKLPSIGKLMKDGTWGNLESTTPPTTPPAWSTVLTGVNPGRHGIFDFRLTPHASPQRPLVDLSKMKSLKIWEVLERSGLASGFLNVPVMYPPAPLKGWMVSGMMTPTRETTFTYPEDLRADLLTAFPEYIIDVDIPKYDNLFWEDMEIFLDDLERCTRGHIDAFLWLWEKRPVDFLMAVFIATDRMGHLLWKFTDPACPQYREKVAGKVRWRVEKIYTMIDSLASEAIARIEKNGGTLIIMSDHGFGPTEAYLNVNRLLEEMGLLRLSKRSARRKRMFYRAWKVGDSRLVVKLLPKGLQRKLRRKIRSGRSSFINDLEPFLDMAGTKAFYASIPCHGIFIRRHGEGAVVVGEREYRELRNRIKKALADLKGPGCGDGALASAIWDREELYWGPMLQHAPDIVFSMKDYSVIPRPLLGATDLLQSAASQPNGFHRMDGIVILYGEGISQGTKLEGARIFDIAPTIMSRMGVPMPPMVEGKALV